MKKKISTDKIQVLQLPKVKIVKDEPNKSVMSGSSGNKLSCLKQGCMPYFRSGQR